MYLDLTAQLETIGTQKELCSQARMGDRAHTYKEVVFAHDPHHNIVLRELSPQRKLDCALNGDQAPQQLWPWQVCKCCVRQAHAALAEVLDVPELPAGGREQWAD